MLPYIHTFCFGCLDLTGEAEKKKSGDKMPCPLCRKEFAIPEDGLTSVQKNFFMQNLLDFKTTVEIGSDTIICDMCTIRNDDKTGQTSKATMRCMVCEDYYCKGCAKVHQFQKASKDHHMTKLGNDTKTETKRFSSMKFCIKHIQKPLDYYCDECKKIVCVSCFVESHKLHNCKDVTTVGEEFRKSIEKVALKISINLSEVLFMKNNNEKRKDDFLKEIGEKEKEIHKRSQELKDVIDRHTQSVLDELSVIKSNNLKEMENQKEQIERLCTILGSFEAYCTELTLKGSASDICSSVDQIIVRADELDRDHEAFIGRPNKSVEISFKATDLGSVLQNSKSNLVGQVEAITSQYEKFAVVVGLSDGTTRTKDVVKINLHRPNEITSEEEIPTAMAPTANSAIGVAADYNNTMYVSGTGDSDDEIWKYNQTSGWLKCASLVQGRRRHSAAFIDEVLYICGGEALVQSSELVLDSVEAFNAINNICTTVGKLVLSVHFSGNCVPFKSSLYIFGGLGEGGNEVNHIQVYDTKKDTCTLISKRVPGAYCMNRAVLWETSVILLECDTCFIFNIESETWQERGQFGTDVVSFGLVLENGRLFIIGGGTWEDDVHVDGKSVWNCRYDIRYVPIQNIIDDKPIEWKVYGKLPKPSLVPACANIRFYV